MLTDFKIQLSDRSFNHLEFLDNQVADFGFDFARLGGCGNISLSLPRNYCDEKFISGDFNLKVYFKNRVTKAYDLRYQGLVQTKTPTIESNREYIVVDGSGYVNQLSEIQIPKDTTFVAMEVSAIVKNILDNYIVGVKDITYDSGDIQNTGITLDTVKYNTDIFSIMQELASVGGNIEWGVNQNRKFYFKIASTTPGFYFNIGSQVINFNEQQSFIDIVNRVIVQGGDVAGSPYTKIFNDTTSQLKYGRRDKVYQSTAITTDTVAQQLATSIFGNYNDVVRKANMDLVNYDSQVEATLPIPLLVLRASGVTYGTKPYGTFLYSGLVNRQINRIQYKVDVTRQLSVSLDLGQYLPDQADKIRQIEYNVDQLRTANL